MSTASAPQWVVTGDVIASATSDFIKYVAVDVYYSGRLVLAYVLITALDLFCVCFPSMDDCLPNPTHHLLVIPPVSLYFSRGHGVTEANVNGTAMFVASVTGVVEKVNKLLTVKPFSTKYSPEVGDVVVGRVKEVADKRWRVDINARQDAALLLSSVNLPGGQRRRTDEDSLQMRAFFQENDLVSAEVQKTNADRSASLHTRSTKYGKLDFGTVITVSAALIKRTKHHCHTIEDLGVDMIIGVNGMIWIAPIPTEEERSMRLKLWEDEGAMLAEAKDGQLPWTPSTVSDVTREAIARLRNCILALSQANARIYKESILAVYNESVQRALSAADVVLPENVTLLTQPSVLSSAESGRS